MWTGRKKSQKLARQFSFLRTAHLLFCCLYRWCLVYWGYPTYMIVVIVVVMGYPGFLYTIYRYHFGGIFIYDIYQCLCHWCRYSPTDVVCPDCVCVIWVPNVQFVYWISSSVSTLIISSSFWMMVSVAAFCVTIAAVYWVYTGMVDQWMQNFSMGGRRVVAEIRMTSSHCLLGL